MQLTLFTDYSLRALIYLAARPDRLCTVKEISQAYGISQNHMVKAMHRLTTLGYVEGRRGRGGGLALGMAPEEINIGEVVEQLEPDFHMAACFDSTAPVCRIDGLCRLKGVLARALDGFKAELHATTLADLVPNSAVLLARFEAAAPKN